MVPPPPLEIQHRRWIITLMTRRLLLRACGFNRREHCWGWKCGEMPRVRIGSRPASSIQPAIVKPPCNILALRVWEPVERKFFVNRRGKCTIQLARCVNWLEHPTVSGPPVDGGVVLSRVEGACETPGKKRVFLGEWLTNQGQVQIVSRSRPAVFLYRPVPVLVVKKFFWVTQIQIEG